MTTTAQADTRPGHRALNGEAYARKVSVTSTNLIVDQALTANSCHWPLTPLRVWAPRSSSR
jgi:hypothetical protein